MPLVPGLDLAKNVAEAWLRADLGRKIVNSTLFAGGVALGKVVIAGLSAFSLVFFRYRGRVLIFWLIFITLMLPLEVRIVPTYAVAANRSEERRVGKECGSRGVVADSGKKWYDWAGGG